MAKRSKDKKAAPSPSFPGWVGHDWFWGLVLILAVILTYSPVWRAGFIWDDAGHVTANPCIVGPLGLKEIWTTSAGLFFPLVLTTFWVEHALWGLVPLPYHLVNVFMHAACAVLLWQVLRNLRVPGAWLGAALWALHPVQVESVAWISEMKNTQSGLFYLLTLLFFVRWLRADANQNGGGWNYALTLLCAAMAMASKSPTLVLPVVLGLCIWWVQPRRLWPGLMRLVPMLLMSVAAAAVTMRPHPSDMTEVSDPRWTLTWPERVATVGDAIWFYLGKLLWPHPLMMIYPRWPIDGGRWVSYLPLLAAMLGFSILWLKRRSWSRSWFFAFAYFLLVLSPFLGLIDWGFWRYSLVEDHLQYLACMGPLALAAAGLVRLADFVFPGKFRLHSILCTGLLFVLAALSWHRAWAYESEQTLWTDTLAKNPDCWGAYNGLGLVFYQRGQMDEAIVQYQKALAINPDYAEAHNNLGLAFMQAGRLDEAMDQYQKTLDIYPNYAEAHNNLGLALVQKGKLDNAIAQFQKAVQLKPALVDARYNLGLALFKTGQLDGAIAQYQKALAINPNFAEAHNNLGNALFQKGQEGNAMVQYQEALAIDPNFAEAHNNLGWALLQNGRVDEAIAQFQEVVRRRPEDGLAQSNLAKAQAMARPPAERK